MVAGIIFLSIHFTTEIEQLQTGLNNSSSLKQLQAHSAGKVCPTGWMRFRWSCYFKSTEKKSWSESRRDCEKRGSDVVILNSKEEKEFVSELNTNEESGIGLRTTENKISSTGFRWEWVDGSLPTET